MSSVDACNGGNHYDAGHCCAWGPGGGGPTTIGSEFDPTSFVFNSLILMTVGQSALGELGAPLDYSFATLASAQVELADAPIPKGFIDRGILYHYLLIKR